ncbi:MAG TPA: Shedu immune nuclease family protein [Rhizomicrobium sp.]|nr:Shedu immune nuclease family protein [Rhizomicrobium sp.]
MTTKKKKKKATGKFVTVNNKGYGNALKGINIFYEGKRPKGLKDDGSLSCGKHILEFLKKRYNKKFRWIISPTADDITTTYGIARVRTSAATLKKINDLLRDRTRDIKHDIVASTFSAVYPGIFPASGVPVYTAGSLARTLSADIISRMSVTDRDALNKFIPEFIATQALTKASVLNASVQIKTLKQVAETLASAIKKNYSENWWQDYIKANILIIQQGYIDAITKMNVAIGGTKFPDFVLVTHDNYLDIMEIKKPDTPLLKHDASRDNYYWEPEITKAIVQVENYIENVSSKAADVRGYIKDKHKIDLKVVRPRGIILAGNASKMTEQKQRDDFRLLSLSTKNILFVTYDELLNRLQNYIKVLEQHAKPVKNVLVKKRA